MIFIAKTFFLQHLQNWLESCTRKKQSPIIYNHMSMHYVLSDYANLNGGFTECALYSCSMMNRLGNSVPVSGILVRFVS
jgi:hypothetical protein